MKFIIFFLLLPFYAWSQTDFDLLNKELISLNKDNINTVILYGGACAHCSGSFYSKYYLSYDSVTEIKSRVIIFYNENPHAKKVFDSIYSCKQCGKIIEYATHNYKSIANQFYNSEAILADKKVVGKDTLFSVWPDQGYCYFLGIRTGKDYTWTYFMKDRTINSLFQDGYNYWVLFNLMKNQWPQLW